MDDIELTGKSKDMISENISYLQKIFPEVFTYFLHAKRKWAVV